jgi:hypothetical protein
VPGPNPATAFHEVAALSRGFANAAALRGHNSRVRPQSRINRARVRSMLLHAAVRRLSRSR